MNFEKLTKVTLRTFLGFLGLTAIIAIVSVLSGEFGEFEWKVIATTFTISLTSICAMSCAAFIARKNLSGIGLSGIGLAVVAAAMVIGGIWWPEIHSVTYWKTTATFGIAALSCAHGFLLVLPDLGDRKKWFQQVSFVSISIFALMAAAALWAEISSEDYYRFMAAVGIVVGLETVSLPILIKLRKSAGQVGRQLILRELPDGTYADTAGIKYEVKPLEV